MRGDRQYADFYSDTSSEREESEDYEHYGQTRMQHADDEDPIKTRAAQGSPMSREKILVSALAATLVLWMTIITWMTMRWVPSGPLLPPRAQPVHIQTSSLNNVPVPGITDPIKENWGGAVARSQPHPQRTKQGFGLVVVAHNRPQYLAPVLQSLADLDNIHEIDVSVSMDLPSSYDALGEVVKKIEASSVNLDIAVWHQQHARTNHGPPQSSFEKSGFYKIANHIRMAVDQAFRQGFKFVVVLEDDLVVAPDFLDVFFETAHLLDEDPTLWCVSAWNDNGQKEVASNERRLFRTDFFPGLGWMITKSVWQELEPKWPISATTGWDYWMRLKETSRERDCIAPEVPRTKHIAVKGTNVLSKQARLLSSHGFASRPSSPGGFGSVDHLKLDQYVREMMELVKTARVVDRIPSNAGADHTGVHRLKIFGGEEFKDIATWLHLWTESMRGGHRGLLVVYPATGGMYLLADKRACPYLPTELRVWRSPELRVVAGQAGEKCSHACTALGLQCDGEQLSFVNNCEDLESVFECEGGCGYQVGAEIPCYVSATTEITTRQCLVTRVPSLSCEAFHKNTRRACACVPSN